MSKESIKASIERKKADIARIRTQIARERSRKSEINARYSAYIKNATAKATKDSYRKQKASSVAYIESSIRNYLSRIAALQREVGSLRAMLKTAK